MTVFSDFQILLCDNDENVLAVGNSIPIFWDGTIDGLPSGWEGAFERGAFGYKNGIELNTLLRVLLQKWEQWAKMRFPESGNYIVPGALTPVQIDCENNVGQYIEPNVWVKHEF